MEINMKDTLRALRQKKNVTQEALARHLGITFQSVGKWERGEGYPDITLLPAIALYFGITVDELLNVDRARIEEKIEAYKAESHRLKNAGEVQENLALWEKAYAEFPNDCRAMCGLMKAIGSFGRWPYRREDAERIIALGERILEESRDTELREEAIQSICYAYDGIGDKENALRYANMGGSMYITRDDLRAYVLDGEEGVRESQEYLVGLINLAVLTAANAVTKTDSSHEEKIRAYEFGIHLWKLLFSDGNVGFYAHDMSMRYEWIAREYAEMQDAEKTLDALAQSTKYAVMTADRQDRPYTAPMVNRLRMDPEASTKNYKGNSCNLRLEKLQWKVYDFIRGDERFRQIKAELEKHAEE